MAAEDIAKVMVLLFIFHDIYLQMFMLSKGEAMLTGEATKKPALEKAGIVYPHQDFPM